MHYTPHLVQWTCSYEHLAYTSILKCLFILALKVKKQIIYILITLVTSGNLNYAKQHAALLITIYHFPLPAEVDRLQGN